MTYDPSSEDISTLLERMVKVNSGGIYELATGNDKLPNNMKDELYRIGIAEGGHLSYTCYSEQLLEIALKMLEKHN